MRGSGAFRAVVAPGGVLAGPWVRNELWRRARAVPSLDLRFADDKSLTDAVTGQSLVTFTRASSGTYVGSDGLIKTATTNLLLRSEDFATTWTLVTASISSDVTIAPNGTNTADKLIVNNGQSAGYAAQTTSFVNGLTYTASCYAKAGEVSDFRFVFESAAFSSNLNAVFNLATGTVSSFTASSASIQPVGNGWYRCIATATATISASAGVQFRSVHAGNGANGIFLFGAQLEQSSTVGEYVPTTGTINSAPRFDHNPTTGESLGLLVEEQRTNLALYSQAINLTNWGTQQATTQTLNAATSPDGSLNATLLAENTQTAPRFIAQTVAVTNAAYTVSIFAKAKERKRVMFRENTTSGTSATFDLQSGTVAGSEGSPTTSIQPYGNGWYRCVMTYTPSSSSSRIHAVYLMPDSGVSFATASYTGDGTSGLYLFGFQVELGAFPTSYIPTTTAAATRAADVASITGSNFGTTRTNLLLRSEAIATSPWFTGANTTLTNNTSEVLDPAGGSTATKVLVSGGTGAFGQGATLTAAIHTGSIWLRCSTGTISASLIVYLSGSPFTNIGTANVTITTFWQRFTVVTSTATAVAYNLQLNNIAVGTVYAWGAQLEVGSAVTPYIPTTTAAVSVFESSWYRQDEGTVFADVLRSYSGNFPIFSNIVSFNDGTANNLFAMYGVLGSQFATNFSVQSGGVGQTDYVQVATNVPGPNRIAQALAVNSSTLAANGALTLQDSSVAMPVGINRVAIGADRLSQSQWGGHIRRLTFFPQRLPNSTLQAITQ